jgi:hypothetical protein
MSNILMLITVLIVGCVVVAVVLLALLAMWSASND